MEIQTDESGKVRDNDTEHLGVREHEETIYESRELRRTDSRAGEKGFHDPSSSQGDHSEPIDVLGDMGDRPFGTEIPTHPAHKPSSPSVPVDESIADTPSSLDRLELASNSSRILDVASGLVQLGGRMEDEDDRREISSQSGTTRLESADEAGLDDEETMPMEQSSNSHRPSSPSETLLYRKKQMTPSQKRKPSRTPEAILSPGDDLGDGNVRLTVSFSPYSSFGFGYPIPTSLLTFTSHMLGIFLRRFGNSLMSLMLDDSLSSLSLSPSVPCPDDMST